MPPSSRKRNKGKDRKAKQLAKKEETERVRLRTIWRRCCSSSAGCDHGCVIIQSDDHPVLSFIDQCCLHLGEKCMLVSKALRELFKTHPQIWNNESYRKLAIATLVHIGTNMMMKIGIGGADITVPICLAQSIIVLEHYNGEDHIDLVANKRVVISKWRDQNFTSSSRRDALKFYRKRTSCKCLKKRHLEARKTMPMKMGICERCEEEKERVLLDVCSRCKFSQYCSRQCQIAAWHEHKVFCFCDFCDE